MYNTGDAARGQKKTARLEEVELNIPAMRASDRTRRSASLTAAVSFEGVRAVAALVDDRAIVLAERIVEFQRPRQRTVAAGIAKLLIDIASTSERGDRTIAAIGVSVPGFVNPENDDRVTIPGRHGSSESAVVWNRVPLKEAIRAELDELKGSAGYTNQTAIHLVPRSAACVLAEAWTGAARDEKDVVFLSLGDEVEAGLLVDGRVVRGAAGRAGAAGWFALSETFRREFEDAGCLSFESGRRSLVRRTIEAWSDEKSSLVSRLSVSHPSEISTAVVLRAARGGDALASRVVVEVCTWVGRAIADLISTLNPAVIVIGGELGGGLKPFLGDLRREARRWAEPGAGRQCRIVASSLGTKGALIGAARAAM